MPKMKTKRSAAKRFKKTASGKIKFKHAFLRHCLENKSKGKKKNLMKSGLMSKADARKATVMLRGG